jgi:predicted DNA-binding transcriptional regulator AlpA
MPQDMLDLLRLDPDTRTLGQLLQEREWANGEITRLRLNEAQRQRVAAKGPTALLTFESPRGIRYLRLRDVCQRVGLRQSTGYRLIGPGRLPKQVTLSEHASSWMDSEVEVPMVARIADRDQRSPRPRLPRRHIFEWAKS